MEFDDIKEMINGLIDDINRLSKGKNKTIKRTIDAANLKGVIDVSFDDEEKIPKDNFEEKPLIKDYKYWILKLDRYHKDPATRLRQINIASLKAYASLCDCLEHYLNKRGTTLARQASKFRRVHFSYDIYYTIYLIAENMVLTHYNPLFKKSSYKSYQIIASAISNEASCLLENKAYDLSKSLKAADKETREYFNLTENGKVSTWWDKDGKLREKYRITKDEELAINQISKRNNVLWKNPLVVEILLDMYLFTLRKAFDNSDIDSKNLITIIRPYQQSKLILDSILIISEKNIRELFTFFNKNNSEKAENILKDFDGGKLLAYIEDSQDKYIKNLDPKFINSIYENHLSENPCKIKDYISYMDRLDVESKIAFIEKIRNFDNFAKILDALTKSKLTEDKIISLYYIYKCKFNKKSHENILFSIIKAENVDDFLKLVESKDLNVETIEEIKSLNKNKVKKIKVDINRIDQSRDKLQKTVNMVNEFLDDDILNEDLSDDMVETIANDQGNYDDILKILLDDGYISKDRFNEFALRNKLTINTFLGKINEELFDYIGDQSLLVEDDKIIIDPFYVDMVKEYLDANTN